jgi:hypothetical protein
MIEVRNLKHDSIAPDGDIWILIEKKGDSYFLWPPSPIGGPIDARGRQQWRPFTSVAE